MTKKWNAIWINATLATAEAGYGLIPNAAIAVTDGKISWLGAMSSLTQAPEQLAEKVFDLAGRCLTPGLIDCHSHIVYAGNRAHEFEQRLHGATYADIARAGYGIQATVNATRAATAQDLYAQSLNRIRALMQSGVTTLEIKSGYGLDLATEIKILEVIQQLKQNLDINIVATFLGAHTIPKDFSGNSDEYVSLVCDEMIPIVAQKKLADAVDVFCETIAFNLAQTERVFATAKQYGLKIKCHAEQLSDSGSAALAANYAAISVDHLEHVSLSGVKAIAKAQTVAVLLPGAFYFLRETKLPPIALLREHGVPIALASDCNPGTSPILSLLIILNMAATLFGLQPEEVLQGVTLNAAKALGIAATHGSLTVGKVADFAVWNVEHPIDLIYYLGANPLRELVKSGKVIAI